MQLWRRIRGLITTAVVWGVVLSAIGTSFILIGLTTGWIPSVPGQGWRSWLVLLTRVSARNFVFGGAVGVAFGLLLSVTERRRTVDTLTLSRVGTWGFLAAAVPTSIMGAVSGYAIPAATLVTGAIAAGLLGVGVSIGIVRLARRNATALPHEQMPSINALDR
jgi:hypothetical protein